MHSQSPCLIFFLGVTPHTHTQTYIYTTTHKTLCPSHSPPLFVHLCFNFGLCREVVKKPYEICMKDCEPRDWPHLPDSRANERPHWIIPHNASGTKAQQLTPERKMGGNGTWEGVQAVKAHCWSGGSSLTNTTYTLWQNKGLWDRNNSLRSVGPQSLLRLFSAPPSLAISPSLPPILTLSLSQSRGSEIPIPFSP